MKQIKNLCFLLIFIICLSCPFDTFAEGSRDLMAINNNGTWTYNTGYRGMIEYNNSQYVGIDRKQLLKVYAEKGETILLATSTYNSLMEHEIKVLRPDGSETYYDIDDVNSTGLILNTTQELAGPKQLGNDAGYESISFIASQTGVYEVTFYPYTQNSDANPIVIRSSEEWDIVSCGVGIPAWDITVAEEKNGVLTAINGRVFTNYLSINTGRLTADAHLAGGILKSKVYVLTTDGYWYLTDFNGLDPYGFIFFSDNRGIIDSGSNTSFMKSIPFSYNTSTRKSFVYPDNAYFYLPTKDDSEIDKTYDIFLNPPEGYDTNSEEYQALPRSIYPLRVSPPTATDFKFTSNEGNGTTSEGVGGIFSFNKVSVAPASSVLDVQNTDTFTFQIEIDFNKYVESPNGDYDLVDGHYEKVTPGTGNYDIYNTYQYYNAGTEVADFDNRVYLSNAGTVGENLIYWDGKDAMGRYVLASEDTYSIKLELKSGEYHFPTIDVEHNISGIKINLINPESSDYKTYLYYDNSITHYNGFADNDATLRKYPSGKPGWTSGQPIKNLDGILGSSGILKYRYASAEGYGNNVIFDAWTYYKSNVDYKSTIKINPAQGLGTLTGLVFYDVDNNKAYDTYSEDYVLPNVNLKIINEETNQEYDVTTDVYGRYTQILPEGTYTVRSSSVNCTTNNYEQTGIVVKGAAASFIEQFNTEAEKEYQGVEASPISDDTFVKAEDIGYQVITNISTEVKFGDYDAENNFVYFDSNKKVLSGEYIYAEITVSNDTVETALGTVAHLTFSDGLDYLSYERIGDSSQDTTYYSAIKSWQIGNAVNNSSYKIRIKLLVTQKIGDKTLTVRSNVECDDAEITLLDNTSSASVTTIQSSYNVVISPLITFGSVTTDKATGFKNDIITIDNITPDEGYELVSVKVVKIDDNSIVPVNPDYTFAMPDGDVLVSAIFKHISYDVIIDDTMTNGTVTTDKSGGDENDIITINSITPAEGYELDIISVTKKGTSEQVTVTNNTFVMPNSDVIVHATFKKIIYDVKISSSITNGVVTTSKDKANGLDEIQINITPSEGYELDTVTVVSDGGTNITVTGNKFTMPYDNVTVSATFKKIIYDVKISPSITNGVVTTSKDKANGLDEIQINITPNKGYELDTITVVSDGGKEITVSNTYTFIMPYDNVTVSATFKEKPVDAPYNVIVDEAITNGSLTTSLDKAYKDDIVSITDIKADEGYELDTITVKTISGVEVKINDDNTFVMPDSDVIVSATFKKIEIVPVVPDNPFTADNIGIQFIMFLVSAFMMLLLSNILIKRKDIK